MTRGVGLSHLAVGGGRGRVASCTNCHEEPSVFIIILCAVIVVQQRRARATHLQVSGNIAVAGRSRADGGPAAGSLAAHAAGSAADAAERDGSNDQRKLQDQLFTAGDVQVDLEKTE